MKENNKSKMLCVFSSGKEIDLSSNELIRAICRHRMMEIGWQMDLLFLNVLKMFQSVNYKLVSIKISATDIEIKEEKFKICSRISLA